jgi:LPS sulfotransferase NodH
MSEVSKVSKDTRFATGQSGNPKGRPRRPRPSGWRALLNAQLEEKVSVSTAHGGRKKITLREAMIRTATVEAARGKTKPLSELVRILAQMENKAPADGDQQDKDYDEARERLDARIRELMGRS